MHIFHFLSALAIIAVNSIALYIFGKSPKMKTPQHLYRINLAVADLLLGVFAFVPAIYFATGRMSKTATASGENFSLDDQTALTLEEVDNFLIFTGFVSWLSFLVSIFTLIAASFDRLLATLFPARYVTNDKCYVTVAVCVAVWVVSSCNLVAGVVTSNASVITSPYFMLVDDRTARVHTLVTNFVSLGLMLVNSLVVLVVLFFHNR